MVLRRFTLSLLLLVSAIAGVRAETVDVKYRGLVPLDHFACTAVERSSFIRRVCFDAPNNYMVIRLNDTYYHYCDINKETVDSLLMSDSMGRFYNASIKGRFDCRTGHVPTY
jgi:KTSC domain